MSFKNKVHKIVSKIPSGYVLSYKEVATLAGNSNASRAVGNIMTKNYDPSIPCHRVIKSDGSIGGYNCGSKKKRLLLRSEGYEC